MVRTGSPAVEMLWEPSDASATLQARFGFESTEAAVGWVASALHELWGIRIDSCERIVMSDNNALAWVVTSSGRMVAKWSVTPDRFAVLAALARLTSWLAEQGLPVSVPVPALDGRVQVEHAAASISLQREVPGELLDSDDPDQVRAAGATLSRLHDALAAWPGAADLPAPVASAQPLADRISRWLDAAPGHTPRAARDTLRRWLVDAPLGRLPVQLVHGDFRSANVLCAGHDVAAVLDFEEARFDHRVVELGRSAALLGTRFHHWGPVSSEVRSQLLEGYQSVRPLTAGEAAWWPALVLWSSLTMVPASDDPTGWAASADALAKEVDPAG